MIGQRMRRYLFAFAALPSVVASGRRIAAADRASGFKGMLESLRAGGDRRLPRWLARPEELAYAVERVLPLLPPRRYGPCLRRSLVLLDLWKRCGLEPSLHLGFNLSSPDRRGHAWLTAETADGRRLEASGPLDTQPAFRF